MALAFPGTEEKPHFEKPSFRYRDRIFATYHTRDGRAMLRLTPVEQSVYVSYNSAVFYPVPGAWGTKGYTMVDISKVRKDIFKEALTAAYNGVAAKPKKKE
ncbi:hypothetical protein GCM10023093_08890 [Nemorincola caseinilytica]|uniref:MmcQ/YjbR family DNA-binding protein n=1 Tax=Nemorincola caseinilytica TaxID=2054315 RepID=A0ABP8NAW0_9BACT